MAPPGSGSGFGGGLSRGHPRALRAAARTAVAECLNVAAGERVLVVTHPDREAAGVAMAVYDAALAAGADPVMVTTRPRGGADLADPALLAALESDPEVLVLLTRGLLGGDPKRLGRPIHGKYTHYLQYLMSEAPTRGFWCPGVTQEAFRRGVPVDLAALRRTTDAWRALLADAVELQVAGRGEGRLVVPVDGAAASAETGDYREPGAGGELPAGEVLVPATGEGVEGSLPVTGALGLPERAVRLAAPIRLEFRDGRLAGATGGDDAKRLEAALADAARLAERAIGAGWLTREQAGRFAGNARRLREVGFGMNPALRPRGDPYGDARAHGVVQLRLGAGRREFPPGAPVSVDLLVPGLSVRAVLADGREVALVENGKPARLVGAVA